ncbi:MAG TPA: porin [Leptolyngbyaceae cyanobacterium M65_K2018_010]|nr:porin [Leptolyngbyaceae cyanobacterium M65_K2018_010]
MPWHLAQFPPGNAGLTPPESTATPGLPAYGPMSGMWMMIWVPYGAPMVAPPSPAQPLPNASGYPPTLPYGMVPGFVPGASGPVVPQPHPGYLPQGPGYAAMPGLPAYLPPGGMVPWGGYAAGAYGLPPSPSAYGTFPSVGGYGPYGSVYAPYGAIHPPASLGLPGPTPNAALPTVPPSHGINPLNQPGLGGVSAGNPTSLPWSNAVTAGTSSVAPAGWYNSAAAGIPPVNPTVTPTVNPGMPYPGPAGAQTLAPSPNPVQPPSEPTSPAFTNAPITESNLYVEGLYILQGDNSSARARISGYDFLSPNWLIGGSIDVVTGPDLTNRDGLQLNELYLATSVPAIPGLRFRLGQLDITSYFDRNSFAKDISRDFFNSTFHTNPALVAGANVTASRPGGLVQWLATDNVNLSAAVFSSAGNIADFALDGLAAEVGFRMGDFVLRGTYVSGNGSEFQGAEGRLNAYGLNAEWFIPAANLGLFGRYGALNGAGGFLGNDYVIGISALDLFMQDDRLGLAYGRNLPFNSVDGLTPDVLELFYDFAALPNLRIGFTFQQRNQFRDSYAGFRIRGGLDVLPNPSLP